MGLWKRIFGSKKTEDQKQPEEETVQVIQIDQKVIDFIPQLILLIDRFLESLSHGLELQHSGTKRMANAGLRGMKKVLNKILKTKRISSDYAEIRDLMAFWATLMQRLRKLPYFETSFGDEAGEIRDGLGMLERLLGLENSILKETFSNLKKE
ncbi:hypothetical protein HOC80_05460 [archaeon]|jgi:hypothetical protein|nr:hypothetical protein [archaeon]MBT4417520.1 hypothetical protein [archaeon]